MQQQSKRGAEDNVVVTVRIEVRAGDILHRVIWAESEFKDGGRMTPSEAQQCAAEMMPVAMGQINDKLRRLQSEADRDAIRAVAEKVPA